MGNLLLELAYQVSLVHILTTIMDTHVIAVCIIIPFLLLSSVARDAVSERAARNAGIA